MTGIRINLFALYVTFAFISAAFAGIAIIDDSGAEAATVTVGKSGSPDYSTVQTAVDAAGSGDTIQVWAGTYNENIVIPAGKKLDIVGAGKTQTIIDGGDFGTVVTVNPDGCTIKNMMITGSGTAAGDAGILLSSDSNTVEGCNITRNNMGIYLNGSDLNTIRQNELNGNYGVDPVNNGLAGHWKLDEGHWDGTSGEVRDSSVNKNHGTAVGGADTAPGHEVRGGVFDGNDDHINLGNVLNTVTFPFSVGAWFNKHSDLPGPIFSSDDPASDSGHYNGFWLSTAGGQINFNMGDGVGDTVNDRRSKVSMAHYQKYEWTHVMAVANSINDVTLYMDGIDVGGKFTGGGSSMARNGYDAKIGVRVENGGWHFPGMLDEIRVYDRSLAQDEVVSIYAEGLTGGIRLFDSHNNTIENNTIIANSGHGIQSYSSNDNYVANNTIQENYCGGAIFDNCTRNDVMNNIIQANHGVDPITAGLAGYWKMDETPWSGAGGEVKDSSGTGNHGTALGGVTTAQGRFGRAGDFDGSNDIVDTGHDFDELAVSDRLTFSAWFQQDVQTVENHIITRYDGTGGDDDWILATWVNKVYFFLRDDGAWRGGTTDINDGKWHHAAATYNGARMKIYVDGILDGSYNVGNLDLSPGTDTIEIGGTAGFSSRQMDGRIDEPRIYDRALSSAEVLQNYVSGIQAGINLRGSDTNRIGNNAIGNNMGSGINLNTSLDNTISTNAIMDNGGCGIILQESNDNKIADNTIISNEGQDLHSNTGLMGHWRMDEAQWTGGTGEVKDSSVLGNHGSAVNGPTTTTGKVKNAGDFDGVNDYVNISGVSDDLDFTDGTLEAWVKLNNSFTPSSPGQIIFCSYMSVPYRMLLWFSHDTSYEGTIGFSITGAGRVYTKQTSWNAQQWYHIVATCGGSGMKIYVDGQPAPLTIVTDTTEGFDRFIPTEVNIGFHYVGAPIPGFFDGLIDEFRIYNRALSDNEVSEHYYLSYVSGIYLKGSNSNHVTGNRMCYSDNYAIVTSQGTTGNQIDHNYFVENNPGSTQARDDGAGNAWDDGSQGNYWSDWLSPDDDAPKGIVDLPYELEGLATDSDDHPLCPRPGGPTDLTPYEDEPYTDNCTIDWAFNPSAWVAVDKPDWLTFGPDGALTGIPTNDDVGLHYVNSTISDDYWSGWHNFTLEVINVNDAPEILTDDITTATEDEEYFNDYDATDIDPTGDTMTWDVETNSSFLDMDGDTGELSGTPTNDDVGDWWVNVTATDDWGDDGWSYFILTVENVNDRPHIIGDDVTDAYEDALYDLKYEVEDVDRNDRKFDWTLRTNASWLEMDDDGYINGIPSNDDIGTYDVNITVKDDAGDADYREFVLRVHNVNDPPSWVTVPPSDTLTAGESYSFTARAEDIDRGDKVSYWLTADRVSFLTIDPATGTIQGTTGEEHVGVYNFNLSATDGDETIYHDFTIEVLSAITNTLPMATLLSPADGSEVDVMDPTFTWETEDADGDEVTSSLYLTKDRRDLDGPVYANPVAEGLAVTSYTPGGGLEPGETYYWTVIPSDTEGEGTCTSGVWSFIVAEEPEWLNYPPEITPVANMTVVEGALVSQQLAATDKEGAALNFSIVSGPDGVTVDGSGMLTWQTKVGDTGVHKVEFGVSDGEHEVSSSFWVTVNPVGDNDGTDGASSSKEGSNTGILILIIVIIVVVIVAILFFYLRSKKAREKEEEAKAAEAGQELLSPEVMAPGAAPVAAPGRGAVAAGEAGPAALPAKPAPVPAPALAPSPAAAEIPLLPKAPVEEEKDDLPPLVPPPPTVKMPAQKSVMMDQLERLAELKDQGILTEEEFTQQKQDILKGG